MTPRSRGQVLTRSSLVTNPKSVVAFCRKRHRKAQRRIDCPNRIVRLHIVLNPRRKQAGLLPVLAGLECAIRHNPNRTLTHQKTEFLPSLDGRGCKNLSIALRNISVFQKMESVVWSTRSGPTKGRTWRLCISLNRALQAKTDYPSQDQYPDDLPCARLRGCSVVRQRYAELEVSSNCFDGHFATMHVETIAECRTEPAATFLRQVEQLSIRSKSKRQRCQKPGARKLGEPDRRRSRPEQGDWCFHGWPVSLPLRKLIQFLGRVVREQFWQKL